MLIVELTKHELKMARKLLIDSKTREKLEPQLCPECNEPLQINVID